MTRQSGDGLDAMLVTVHMTMFEPCLAVTYGEANLAKTPFNNVVDEFSCLAVTSN